MLDVREDEKMNDCVRCSAEAPKFMKYCDDCAEEVQRAWCSGEIRPAVVSDKGWWMLPVAESFWEGEKRDMA